MNVDVLKGTAFSRAFPEVTEALHSKESQMLQCYKTTNFTTLQSFRQAKAVLSARKSDVTILGDVICRHSLQELLGVNLLHKHFEIAGEERVTRFYSTNAAEMRPECDARAIPYIWRFTHTQARYELQPTEFLDPLSPVSELTEAVAAILQDEVDFVQEFGVLLDELDLIDSFGLVALSSGSIQVADTEILLETTDYVNRRLNLRPTPLVEVEDEVTETTWSFSIDGVRASSSSSDEFLRRKRQKIEEFKKLKQERLKEPIGEATGNVESVCTIHCGGCCTNHCTSHCHSHCVSHP